VNVDAIERARILRGWTLVDLARAARVDRGTLSDLIHEVHHPTLGTVQAIASALGLAMTEAIVFIESPRLRRDGRETTSADPTLC